MAGAPGQDLTSIIKSKQSLNQTVWKEEIEAQRHEETFIQLWDDLRKSDAKLEVLKAFAFDSLRLGTQSEKTVLDHGIAASDTSGAKIEFDSNSWAAWVDAMKAQGYRFFQSEWHHSRFEASPSGANSVVSIVLHVYNEKDLSRYIIEGKIKVSWHPQRNGKGRYTPKNIDASDLTILQRTGMPFYKEAFNFDVPSRGEGALMTCDLNQDNLPEIILPGINAVLWNIGEKGYGVKPLNEVAFVSTKASVIGDFTGDGYVDLLCIGEVAWIEGQTPEPGMYLLKGAPSGFSQDPPIKVNVRPAVEYLQGIGAIATGDVDGDGDLDMWVSQYKATYVNGSMPTPYFDANDGYSSYLLLNDGSGISYRESTEAAGLSDKRNRRTYSNSFYDYDGDSDLDLVVVSDFAGVDLHRNDGKGSFEDVTGEAIDNRSLFGMGHAFGDFNRDGLIDLYATGMSSTTASRLDAMDANRSDFPDRNRMRIPMTYGNRLYEAQADGSLTQPNYAPQVARTGWAWGAGAFDYDNNGELDIYVANGHFSGNSAKDYCSNFWTDDIYRGSSQESPIFAQYFKQSVQPMVEGNVSWNGFEHNFLFAKMEDGTYRNISFLMGIADELDSRRVITEDANGDGRVDIIVTQLNYREDKDSSWVKIYRNVEPLEGNWIGVNVIQEPGSPSPLGAKILVVDASGIKRSAVIVSGDSFQAQHSSVKHFGLGSVAGVDYIEVTWPNGRTQRLDKPSPNQYHPIR